MISDLVCYKWHFDDAFVYIWVGSRTQNRSGSSSSIMQVSPQFGIENQCTRNVAFLFVSRIGNFIFFVTTEEEKGKDTTDSEGYLKKVHVFFTKIVQSFRKVKGKCVRGYAKRVSRRIVWRASSATTAKCQCDDDNLFQRPLPPSPPKCSIQFIFQVLCIYLHALCLQST